MQADVPAGRHAGTQAHSPRNTGQTGLPGWSKSPPSTFFVLTNFWVFCTSDVSASDHSWVTVQQRGNFMRGSRGGGGTGGPTPL